MQNEITKPGELLGSDGCLASRGYAKKLLLRYDREAIAAAKHRIKEWDYYYVGNDSYGVALTVADNSYMGLVSVSLLDFRATAWQQTTSVITAFPWGKTGMPGSSIEGDVRFAGKRCSIAFLHTQRGRLLTCEMKNFQGELPFSCEIMLTDEPRDSIVMMTPYAKDKKAFYYNQKINCMRASGQAEFGGKSYAFRPEDSFGVLDWGRGVWTYSNTWYWGSASGVIDGAQFGFNIGYGFGDTSAASENMLFYNGQAHKLEEVTFHIPKKDGAEDYLSPWRFSSSDGRFEMTFAPIIDRAACTNALIIKSDQHQVFGRFTGKAVLDDGRELHVKNLMGFAEKVKNRW